MKIKANYLTMKITGNNENKKVNYLIYNENKSKLPFLQ